MADFLNGFFSAVTDVVFAHQEDHAARAVAAAKDILQALAELNQRRAESPPLRVRMAINSGTAIVGDVGSGKRLEYTVLGDVVNTASRMESGVAKPIRS